MLQCVALARTGHYSHRKNQNGKTALSNVLPRARTRADHQRVSATRALLKGHKTSKRGVRSVRLRRLDTEPPLYRSHAVGDCTVALLDTGRPVYILNLPIVTNVLSPPHARPPEHGGNSRAHKLLDGNEPRRGPRVVDHLSAKAYVPSAAPRLKVDRAINRDSPHQSLLPASSKTRPAT